MIIVQKGIHLPSSSDRRNERERIQVKEGYEKREKKE